MTRNRLLLISALVFVLTVGLIPNGGAQTPRWSHKAYLTFSRQVEIPGRILPPGTYVFRLIVPENHIGQVLHADETEVFGIFFTRDFSSKAKTEFRWFTGSHRATAGAASSAAWATGTTRSTTIAWCRTRYGTWRTGSRGVSGGSAVASRSRPDAPRRAACRWAVGARFPRAGAPGSPVTTCANEPRRRRHTPRATSVLPEHRRHATSSEAVPSRPIPGDSATQCQSATSRSSV